MMNKPLKTEKVTFVMDADMKELLQLKAVFDHKSISNLQRSINEDWIEKEKLTKDVLVDLLAIRVKLDWDMVLLRMQANPSGAKITKAAFKLQWFNSLSTKLGIPLAGQIMEKYGKDHEQTT